VLEGLRQRLRTSIDELDCARLQDRFAKLSLTQIADAPMRCPVVVGGEIKRVLIAPHNGMPTLEIVVGDGTGTIVAMFTGRRNIAGLEHGRAVVLEGVAHEVKGKRVILNPAYTLLS
jgi:DNA/RNA endonuclease YhcR with UshA esterase domain